MGLSFHEYVVARQCNDGDCLPASLSVITSILSEENMLLNAPILEGDGNTMRALLSDFISKRCDTNEQFSDSISWRDLVEADCSKHWVDSLDDMAKGAVYKNGCMIRSGTFVGETFLRAFECIYGFNVSIFVKKSAEYDAIVYEGYEGQVEVALLRTHNHFDVIISKNALSNGGWVIPNRSGRRTRARTSFLNPSTGVQY